MSLCDPMDCSLPGSSVHGILQARILESVAIPDPGIKSACLMSPAFQVDSLPLAPCGKPFWSIRIVVIEFLRGTSSWKMAAAQHCKRSWNVLRRPRHGLRRMWLSGHTREEFPLLSREPLHPRNSPLRLVNSPTPPQTVSSHFRNPDM